MKLAICLLTADRHEYTAKTVHSLMKTNPDYKSHLLLHADDASGKNFNMAIVSAAGFSTVITNPGPHRCGAVPLLRYMWLHAGKLGATHILHLENDQEFAAAIPSRRDAQSVRLYGARKERGDGSRAWSGTHVMGTDEVINWRFDGHDWERATCHWGAQASITETELLLGAIDKATTIKDVSRSLQRIDTIRPHKNITWHIGEERTVAGVSSHG